MGYRKYRKIIASGAIVSIVSFILVCTSFTSDDWIDARGSVVNNSITDNYSDSIIHYGLFKGKLKRTILSSPKIYNIYFTCVWEENLCAWSCLKDEDTRLNEVKALIRGQKPTFSCSSQSILTWPESRSEIYDQNNTNYTFNRKLLNAGMNFSATFSVIMTMISLSICAILGMVNYKKCPKREIFNLSGVILLSIVAFICNIAGLIVYGFYFNYSIKENIAILDTIVGEYESSANLGSGYWLFMVGCLLNPMTILLLYVRKVLTMENRMKQFVIVANVNDPTTVLY